MRRLLALIAVAVLALPLAAQAATLSVSFDAERREHHGRANDLLRRAPAGTLFRITNEV